MTKPTERVDDETRGAARPEAADQSSSCRWENDDMENTRVLIVDDHPVFLHGLASVLAADDQIDVVGSAETGEQAIVLAADLQPDVVVMDVQLPGINGVEATREIVHTSPHIGVLMLTMFSDDESVFAAMRAGARGYLLKGADHAEILQAVLALGRGTAVFGQSIAQRIIDYFATPARGAPNILPELTDREREVLTLVAEGEPNAVIAHRLHLSPKTVRNHVSNIFSKLQVADRTQAAIRARRAGLTSD